MSIDNYEKPSVTTDMILMRIDTVENINTRRNSEKTLQVLLMRRTIEPDKGMWALPGAFVGIDEELLSNVKGKLKEKTGVDGNFYIEQLYTWDNINRDSRGRVFSVSFLGLANSETYKENGTENEIVWANVYDVLNGKYGELAFDHLTMIEYALHRIRNKIEYTDVAFHLLPTEFTIRECQDVFEIILGHSLNNFRRTIANFVEPVGEERKINGKQFRPAKLFVYKPKNI